MSSRIQVPRVRVRTWLSRHKLDLQLAAGADPNPDPMLRQRALELLDPDSRRRLANSLEELVDESVLEFDLLVERLRAPAPIRAQGVAKASLLVIDATGPLWGAGGDAELSAAAVEALNGLDLGPALDGF